VEASVVVDVRDMLPTWRGQLVRDAPLLRSCEEVQALGFMIAKDGGVGAFALDVLSVQCLV